MHPARADSSLVPQALTHANRRETERCRVKAVAPGHAATPMRDKLRPEAPDVHEQWSPRIPMGRLNTPREIANAAAFLFSDLACGITASVLYVDGGDSAR